LYASQIKTNDWRKTRRPITRAKLATDISKSLALFIQVSHLPAVHTSICGAEHSYFDRRWRVNLRIRKTRNGNLAPASSPSTRLPWWLSSTFRKDHGSLTSTSTFRPSSPSRDLLFLFLSRLMLSSVSENAVPHMLQSCAGLNFVLISSVFA
jgi:hypothetical protein